LRNILTTFIVSVSKEMFRGNGDVVVFNVAWVMKSLIIKLFLKCSIDLAYHEVFKSFSIFFGQNQLCTNGLFNVVEKDMIAASAWKLKRLFQIRKKAQIVNNECD